MFASFNCAGVEHVKSYGEKTSESFKNSEVEK